MTNRNSRFPGFYKVTVRERRELECAASTLVCGERSAEQTYCLAVGEHRARTRELEQPKRLVHEGFGPACLARFRTPRREDTNCGGRGDAEPFRDLAGRQAGSTRLDQQTEHVEAVFLGQR